ncbi:hypothetical protein GQ53DRAFT_830071 [Thozetella sp. PMI_491]|nr:hypothetical protein GQ53DRAFT_830071 [Thozetella sp. PMI_491]
MYQSYFGYSLARKYPFKWFTWAAAIGGILLTGLISALNVALAGYNTEVLYSTDPNATESEVFWYDRFTYVWTNKVSSSRECRIPCDLTTDEPKPSSTCQSTNIATGSTLYTSTLNFPYTITGIRSRVGERWVSTPSIPYHNEVMSSCRVGAIKMTTQSDPSEYIGDRWIYDVWLSQLESLVQCNSSTAIWDLSFTWKEHFAATEADRKTQASIRWGQTIVTEYFYDTQAQLRKLHDSWDTKALVLDDTLDRYYLMAAQSSDGGSLSISFFIAIKSGAVVAVGPTDPLFANLSTPFRRLATSMQATIMADLGQNGSNLLTDPKLLQNYTADFGFHDNKNSTAGDGSYFNLTDQGVTGPLGVNASAFYAQYLCQVPRLKPAGSLVASVLLANLVYLAAAWRLLNWGAVTWLERQDKNAMFCQGCMERKRQEGMAHPELVRVNHIPEADFDQPLLKRISSPSNSV